MIALKWGFSLFIQQIPGNPRKNDVVRLSKKMQEFLVYASKILLFKANNMVNRTLKIAMKQFKKTKTSIEFINIIFYYLSK